MVHRRLHNSDPSHHPHHLAGAPPQQAPVLPAERGGAAVQLHRPTQQPALHRRPGHHRLPQPQRPRRHLLRPRQRLRRLQEPADHPCHRPAPVLPGPQRRRHLDQSSGFLLIHVKIDGLIRWKVGSWTSDHYHLFVSCPAFLTFKNGRPGSGVQQLSACSVEV
ncbi:Harpin-induced protein 1 [Musa troglodytarum]|uniref:Harpin-induced protein 1 n=1 Tax=Musa troglodytarum TaxID=320322 RepID=A0A9E7KER9_9LILI|nr:Harpin-induced protein 1 [Musa troglodytarum]